MRTAESTETQFLERKTAAEGQQQLGEGFHQPNIEFSFIK
jgi:hypothetical protein